MKWTHKVVYVGTGQWWMATLRDGIFYHNGVHEDGQEPKEQVLSLELKEPSIEASYSSPKYKVIKLNTFKGNL